MRLEADARLESETLRPNGNVPVYSKEEVFDPWVQPTVGSSEYLAMELQRAASIRAEAAKIRLLAIRQRSSAIGIRETAARICRRAFREPEGPANDEGICSEVPVVEDLDVIDAADCLPAAPGRCIELDEPTDAIVAVRPPSDEAPAVQPESVESAKPAPVMNASSEISFARNRPGAPIELPMNGEAPIQSRNERARGGRHLHGPSDATQLPPSEEMFHEIRDHVERRVAERTSQLRESAELADQANQRKSQFLARMSHELRTPLNAIIGFSEIIQAEMFGPVGLPVYADYARDIHASAGHLLDLINDLLDLSKIEAEKFELSDDVLDLPELIIDVMRTIEPTATAKRLDIAVEIENSLPQLRADRRAAKQILLNLLSNAVKFSSDQGQVQVRVSTRDGGVAIAVQDSGVGIDPERLGSILTPYVQGPGPQFSSENGTGLGLPIAKSLIELHGGGLEVKSKKDRGTVVTVYYPADRALTDASLRDPHR